ncbi:prephenate dehydrogenase/arogenate dehydrogenase family protein [Stieleria sp. TO1_6]|uniref:prephenate dehydrogenase n=1 Tax=Stieleria tagensis TaxID=2956795 RepID=UPI00209B56BC|nr:prephenate dehydrogenase/arogenate dehydrogenase family protein [Stieleria tagensis]MCO8124455.1 prephenate dehydrogenase/arogenate dehydrogenase family protein [Stieleria tagensis]
MHSLPDKPAWLSRVAILGVGLLGGSVGMSLRRSGIHVRGYSRRQSSCQDAIAAAAVDDAFTDLATACEGCQVVVIAAPVDKIAELAIAANDCLAADALITDVGSTKARIVAEIESLSPATSQKFVAAHPIAGSEKTGVQNACPDLLDGKAVILTPGADTATASLDRAKAFWRQTGGRILTMTPQQHDDRLAAVSHLPHLVSSLLASLLDEPSMPLIGSGWKDMTRVASGDPTMWTAICQHNRDAILAQIDRLSAELAVMREKLADPDTTSLMQWLQDAKARKDATQ